MNKSIILLLIISYLSSTYSLSNNLRKISYTPTFGLSNHRHLQYATGMEGTNSLRHLRYIFDADTKKSDNNIYDTNY